jgi:hypothetical protein
LVESKESLEILEDIQTVENPSDKVHLTPYLKYLDLHERHNNGGKIDDDAFKTMEQLANKNGFAVEKYQVVTSDGYILGLYRIPGTLSEMS